MIQLKTCRIVTLLAACMIGFATQVRATGLQTEMRPEFIETTLPAREQFLFKPASVNFVTPVRDFLQTDIGRRLIQADPFWGDLLQALKRGNLQGNSVLTPIIDQLTKNNDIEYMFGEDDKLFDKRSDPQIIEKLIAAREKARGMVNAESEREISELWHRAKAEDWKRVARMLEPFAFYDETVSNNYWQAQVMARRLEDVEANLKKIQTPTQDFEALRAHLATTHFQAIMEGNEHALECLGVFYEDGVGGGIISPDPVMAMKFYDRAGTKNATYRLVGMHLANRNVIKAFRLSRELLVHNYHDINIYQQHRDIMSVMSAAQLDQALRDDLELPQESSDRPQSADRPQPTKAYHAIVQTIRDRKWALTWGINSVVAFAILNLPPTIWRAYPPTSDSSKGLFAIWIWGTGIILGLYCVNKMRSFFKLRKKATELILKNIINGY